MLLRRRVRAAAAAVLIAAAAVAPAALPASAQTADRDARLGWVRERYMAEKARVETLRAGHTADAALELGEYLIDGELISPENPLRKPDLEGAKAAFEASLKVPSKLWPLGASQLAEILFAGKPGALATPEEVARGVDLLSRAAALGYGAGAFRYGVALEAGLAGPDKVGEASDAYRLGARLQYPEATFALARLVGFDSAEGRALVAQGLLQFDLYAPRSRGLLVAFGDIERDGVGVPADPGRAMEAYRRAFAMGSGRGGLRTADLLLSTLIGPPDPAEARRVLEETAWSGSSFAAVRLARDFAEDGPMAVDAQSALAWLDLAMAVEDYRAFAVAARLAFAGKGMPRDPAKAEEYARKALADARAPVGDVLAVADAARAGLGEGAPAGLMRDLYRFAAERGSVSGMAEYGTLLLDASPGGDIGTALGWLQQAADAGSAKAMVTLGDLYRDGRAGEPSPEAALGWYEKAIATGRSLGAYVRAADVLLAKPELADSLNEPVDLLERAAAQGSGSAELRLGRLALTGTLMPRDPQAAKRWLEAAVSHGESAALVLLADFYQGKFGDPPDPAAAERILTRALDDGTTKAAARIAGYLVAAGRPYDAVRLLENAADKGNAEALIELGLLFLGGNAVPRDLARAEGYFDRASVLTGSTPKAETDLAIAYLSSGEPLAAARGRLRLEELAGDGVGRAAAALSEAFRIGAGVPVDPAAAERWAREAAKLGYSDPLIAVAESYSRADRPPADQEKAVALYETVLASEPGSVRALNALARAYKLGRGTRQDLPRALAFLRQAADAGSGSALVELADAYAVGAGVERDPKMAVTLLERAVARGVVGAYVDLGRFYLSGFGGEIDAERAVLNFARAAGAGNLGGMLEYGRSLVSGYGVAKNVPEGAGYLERAANAGVVDAMTELFQLYSSGFDVPPDMDRALPWLERAAASDDDALMMLADLLESGTVTMDPARAARWKREAERRGTGLRTGGDGAALAPPPGPVVAGTRLVDTIE